MIWKESGNVEQPDHDPRNILARDISVVNLVAGLSSGDSPVSVTDGLVADHLDAVGILVCYTIV